MHLISSLLGNELTRFGISMSFKKKRLRKAKWHLLIRIIRKIKNNKTLKQQKRIRLNRKPLSQSYRQRNLKSRKMINHSLMKIKMNRQGQPKILNGITYLPVNVSKEIKN